MKHIKFILPFLIIFSVLIVLIANCEKKPTAPEHENPLDAENPATSGDPFQLQAQISGGGVTLSWNAVDISTLHGYSIYRTETENRSFSKLTSVSKNNTSYVDQTIENGHRYWYKVTAYEANGRESSQTNVAAVRINTDPVIVINGGDQYTPSREVNLTILATTATQIWISNDEQFSEGNWEDYKTTKTWTLLTGEGSKTVYLKAKYSDDTISDISSDGIEPQPMDPSVIIADDSTYTATRNVAVKLSATGENVLMKVSEDSSFSEVSWENFTDSKNIELSTGSGLKTIFAKFKNDFEIESEVISDDIEPQPMKPSITVAGDCTYTSTRNVAAQLSVTGENLLMKVSEDSSFAGVSWESYATTKNITLSTGRGTKTVYAVFKNDFEFESEVVYDDIEPQQINDASVKINNDDQYTGSRDVTLTILASGATHMKVSEDSSFNSISWENFAATKNFTLSTSEGTMNVYVRFKNDFDMESSTMSDNIVLDTTPPTAAFSVSPNSGITAETTFNLNATATTDNLASDSDIQIRWDWDNDGSYDTGWSAAKTASHTYSTGGGNKTVKLEAKDGAGNSSSATQQIYVNSHPVASFTVTPASGDITDTFTFDASACSDYEDNASTLQVRWDWDGDGSYDTNYSTTKTATHQYSSYGNKNVILQVKDSSSLTDTTEHIIAVIEQIEGMIYVAAGSFQMGSNSGSSDEQPVHTVNLDAFYIDKYEVTNAKYAAYLNEALSAGEIQATWSTVTKDGDELLDLDESDCQISYFGGNFVVERGKDNYPVIEVSWYGATAYAEHYGKRLPTEAEWEYAARGGGQSQGYTYSGSNNVGDVAWYNGNSGSSTHTVGTKQPNELGIYDMSGNVWEWCHDWYDSGYYSSSPGNNPNGPTSGTYRVLRGGSFYYSAIGCRVAYRHYFDVQTDYYDYVGFRCVR